MNKLRSRAVWGILLIVAGLLFLLETLNVVAVGGIWGILFAIGGAIFLAVFVTDRASWWAAIPGMSLVGLGGLITLSDILPGQAGGSVAPAFFLGCIGLGFILVYIATRTEQWWALIPGGVLISLAVALALEPLLRRGEAFVGIFFLGMAATFLLVYLLPKTVGRMGWALIPAAILGVMGVIFLSMAVELINLVWAAALIIGGGYLIVRNLRHQE